MVATVEPKSRDPLAPDVVFLSAWAVLFLASATATVAWCGPMSDGMPMPGDWTMSMAWMRMPGQSWLKAGAAFIAMWGVMMLAMMLPCLVPPLLEFRRSLRASNLRGAHLIWLTTVAGAGYFTYWVLFGAAAYPIGAALTMAEMRWEGLSRSVPLATAGVLILAGCFQLTHWKARQLEHCRQEGACGSLPGAGSRYAWRFGFGFGRHCGACCLGFMVLLLVLGAMDLRLMAIVTAAIFLERVVPKPRRAAWIMGLIMIMGGVAAGVWLLGIAHRYST